MKETLDALTSEIEGELSKASSLKELEALRVRFLGKKGPIQALMQDLRTCEPSDRPAMGKAINDLKVEVTGRLDALQEALLIEEESSRLEQETIDITLPGRKPPLGRKHPISAMMDEILDIHMQMGFSVQYGPDIESDYYNFEALNFEADHPARDMHDTYYIAPEVLLRTHTSNTQVRVMEHNQPPIRVATPGRCYRNEDISARSHTIFHQVDGLYIDEGVTFGDLLQTLNDLLSRIFNQKIELRFRASYFPFVEPGIEVDVGCLSCDQKGCGLCKQTGWLEVLGAGMVHEEVLKNGGIDPEKYTGYAWGIGIERLILLKQGVSDIRLFTQNDQRFLSQFA